MDPEILHFFPFFSILAITNYFDLVDDYNLNETGSVSCGM